MNTDKNKSIVRRIERDLNAPALSDRMADQLSPSDLNSLLTRVFAQRTEKTKPADMLKQYAQNGYAKPAACDAVQYRRLEADMLAAAEEKGARSILLSPASLLGCCSVFGAVSQNKIISAIRNLELLSDATNMLALIVASEIKNGSLSHADDPVHLCTTHRHIRYQPDFKPGMFPHFGIFTMVSAGKSRGSYAFETEALLFHLRFYHAYWLRKHGSPLSLSLFRRGGYKDPDGFISRVMETIKENLGNVEITIGEQGHSAAYYKGLQIKLYAQADGKAIEVGDIGFTDWTQRLLNNKGERLLISAMALDRQLSV
ncbi:MAG: hypothetical protein FWG37_03990 [Clostridia bacterium]|nr:hypothetical protein [Clostridia bacterium]